MKINCVNNILFNGKIIDSHAHIGKWKGADYSVGHLDVFTKSPLSNGDVVERIIVSNLSGIDNVNMLDEIQSNKMMLEIANKNPKLAPLAVCQPKTGSVENIKNLFNENPGKFVGLKFHPDGHEIMASDNLFNPYLKFAEEKNLPCIFHCGINWQGDKLVDEAVRYSSPDEVYKAAKKIPKTPVILAHLGAGGEVVHEKAIAVILSSIDNKDANLYADISWVDIDNPEKPNIIKVIRKLKEKNALEKIMFGSDAPIGEFDTGKDGMSGKELYNKTVKDIKAAIRKNFPDEADSINNKLFYENANKLFFNPQKQPKFSGEQSSSTPAKSKSKIIPIILIGLAVVGIVTAGIIKKQQSINNQPNRTISLTA